MSASSKLAPNQGPLAISNRRAFTHLLDEFEKARRERDAAELPVNSIR